MLLPLDIGANNYFAKVKSFLNCKDSVTEIGDSAFYGCRGFNGTLKISDNVTEHKGDGKTDGIFQNCSGFTKLILPNSVESIGCDAFEGCSGFTGKLMIPDGVTEICENAFKGCSGFTGDLIVPDSVVRIGNDAFMNCRGFNGDLIIAGVKEIGYEAFAGCKGFTGSLKMNHAVEIGPRAFFKCSGFTGELILPDSVENIEEEAFFGCSGLTGSLRLSSGLVNIGRSAFFACRGMDKELILPETLKVIGEEAFYLTQFDKVISLGKDCDIYYSEKTIPETADIYGYSNSAIEEYAKIFGRNFMSDHSYEKTVISDSTCVSTGTVKNKCIICGDEYDEAIAVKSHNWNAGIITKGATCTEAGVKTYTCSSCKAVRTEVIPAARNHTWGAWTQVIAPTMQAEGKEQRTCSVCKTTEARSVAKLPVVLAKTVLKTASVVNGDNIQINWKAVENADGYIVYRKAGSSWKKIATCAGNTLNYTDKNTKLGTKYTYTVKAYADLATGRIYGDYDRAGVSITQSFSGEAVELTSIKAVSAKSIKIQWKPRSKATGYTVFRRIPGQAWKKLGAVKKGTSYTDKKCKASTIYQYTVKAYKKNGSELVYSNYKKNGLAAVTQLPKPKFTVTSKKKKTATVKWKKQSNISGYVIYRKKGANGQWEKIKTLGAKTTSYTDKNRTSKATYYYRVKTYKKGNAKYGITEPFYSTYYTKKVKVK